MVTCGFFNSVYGDRKYDADQMSDFYTGIVTQGVFQHVDNGLEVTAGTGLTVSVNTGRAIIQNKWVKNDTPLVLELAPAPTTYGRFDRVVLKYDSNNRNVQIIVKTGTPLGTPVAPELVRDGGIYEMCLADIDVEAGATSVTVTDTRSDPNLCGWAAVAQATSGEVDQMLNDMKTGFDGVDYSSPADAVTSQVKNITGALYPYNYLNLMSGKQYQYYSAFNSIIQNQNDPSVYTYDKITLQPGKYYYSGVIASYPNRYTGGISGSYTFFKIGNTIKTLNQIANTAECSFILEDTAEVCVTGYMTDSVPMHTPAAIISDQPLPQYGVISLFNALNSNLLDVKNATINKYWGGFNTILNASGGEWWMFPKIIIPEGRYYCHLVTDNINYGGIAKIYSYIKVGSNEPVQLSTILNDDGSFSVNATSIVAITGYLPGYVEDRHVPYAYISKFPIMQKEIDAIKKNIPYTGSENIINVGSTRTYTKIQDAVNAITDASSDKRYTILVDPGTYDISSDGINYIPIKPYIKIQGIEKGTTKIIFTSETKNSNKNVFQNVGSGFSNGYAEVCNFTIYTNNIKGTLHLDDTSWTGEVYFHNIDCYSYASETALDPTLDYYISQGASIGTINLATHVGQKIVLENIQTNGYIYSHTMVGNYTNMDTQNGGTFIVENCRCNWIGVYASGDKVRKKCILKNNKCDFIKISFNDYSNLGFMAWDVELDNNDTDFVQGLYKQYQSNDFISLWENYYNGVPCSDSNLHNVVQNKTANSIPFRSKVNYTDDTHRYIEPATGDTYDAILMCSVAPGEFGVVQDGGNLVDYETYLATHELS